MPVQELCAPVARVSWPTRKRLFCHLLASATLLTIAGCGASYETSYGEADSATSRSLAIASSQAKGQGNEPASAALTSDQIAGRRHVIYVAELDLVVPDFTGLPDKLLRLVEQYEGYIAEADIKSAAGSNRHGHWKIRIPVDSFDGFLQDVSDLGVPRNLKQTTEDVTEEFVDLEAQIASKRKLEQRILDFLEASPEQLEEVIRLEQEMERIRSAIERMEGRLRYLRNRTELTTITLSVHEEQEFIPPQSPTFDDRVGETWSSSLGDLQSTGESIALFFVGVTPWLPVILLGLAMLWLIGRKVLRARVATSA